MQLKTHLHVAAIMLLCLYTFGQNKTYSDSLDKRKVVLTSSAIGATWAGSMTGLYQLWYKNTERSAFHTIDDSRSWLQMDKLGHVYTAWRIGDLCGEQFKRSGINHRKAALIGSLIGLGYQSTLEIFDGHSAEWGFSWADMASNTAGSIAYYGQEILWAEQRFKMKFSYHPTNYAMFRPNVLGKTHAERLFKDYNGQSYWISFCPADFSESIKIPRWLNLSLGYSVDEKLKGDEEIYSDINSNGLPVTFYSKREFLLSLDIDLSRIPVKNKFLRSALKQLNHLKVPMPTIRFTPNSTYGHWIYF
jgi:uncharacterized protein YfiM (DUF2279 family)